MPTSHKIGMNSVTVYSDSTSDVFFPATPWMDASQVGKIRGTFELIAKTGVITVAVGYQTANVEDSPDNAVSVGTYASSNGMAYPTALTDISANTTAKQLVRFGWMVKLSSGSTQAYAMVWGTLDIQECD